MLFGFVFLSVFVLSFWHVFYRDIQFVVQFVMNLAFFVTPIFYSISFVSEKYQWLFKFNIFIPFIRMFHDSLYSLNLNMWLVDFAQSAFIVIALAIIAVVSFKKKIREFYTYV
jgi:ABC-type polysaccharide/polyol phosphate export permease